MSRFFHGGAPGAMTNVDGRLLALLIAIVGGCGDGSGSGVDAALAPDSSVPDATLDGARPTARLAHPLIFVSQVPSDAGEFQVNDIHGNFRGDNPVRDQPVGGNLFRLDPGAAEPVNLTRLDDVAVRNPEVSWEGERVVFSMKRGARGLWQLYEMGTDGTGLRQLTDTPYNETEPVYLPDGRIAFASDRQGLLDAYENFPTGQLHVMDADGGNVRPLSSDPGGDTTPTVDEEGRLLFTRWSVTSKRPCETQRQPIDFDEHFVSRFLLWRTAPDGRSDAHPIFGAHLIQDLHGGFVQARPLRDGTGRILTVMAQASTWGAGALAIVDPADEVATNGHAEDRIAFVTSPREYTDAEDVEVDDLPFGGRFRDPYPLAGGGIVASYADGIVLNLSFDDPDAQQTPNFRLVHVAGSGGTPPVIYDDPTRWELEPVEVVARPRPPVIADAIDWEATSGVLNVMDIALDAGLPDDVPNPALRGEGPRGEAAWVHIYRGVPTQLVYPGLPGYRQIQPGLLGRAPVRSDGSFAARVPADTPLLWAAYDAEGRRLVEERFWNAVRPSQTLTCSGCHAPHDGRLGRTTNEALAAPTDLSGRDPTSLIPADPLARGHLVEWRVDQPHEVDPEGLPVRELFGVDGEARSDADAVEGQVTFRVGVCVFVDDPRLFTREALTALTELRVDAGDESAALVAALVAEGLPARVGDAPLPAGDDRTTERCTALVPFVVPVGTERVLRFEARDRAAREVRNTLRLRAESLIPLPAEEREDPNYDTERATLVQGGCDPID